MEAIFSIFRAYPDYKDSLKKESQEKLINYLKKDYNLIVGSWGNSDLESLITRSFKQNINFKALLTNVPPSQISFNPDLSDYEKYTLDFLNNLRIKLGNPKIPFIAYTSVKPEYVPLFRSQGISALVYKKTIDNWENEAKEIKFHLDNLIKG